MLFFLWKTVIAITFLFLPSAVLAIDPFSASLPEEVNWFMSVREQAAGEVISKQGTVNELLLPGSLPKLWVSGTALQDGEPDSFETNFLVAEIKTTEGKNSIFLQGHGNALLNTTELQQIASALTRTGITVVQGDVVADTTFFQAEDWNSKRGGSAYAMPGALGLDLHTVRVSAQMDESGQPLQVTIEPPNEAVRFAVAARTAASGSSTLRIEQLDDLGYKVTGNLPADAGGQGRRFPLQDSALYAAGTLKTLMQEAGIEVKGKVRRGRTPDDAVELAKIPGPPLDDVLRDMNFHSLNVVADNLLLTLGAERFGPPGTREKGVKAVREFLQSLDLSMDEVEIYDGSGLSDKNRVSADFMARYLIKVSKKPWFERFKNTLPRPGYEGTVKDIGFRDDRFRVKTGRLEDVYALAGYGVDGAGKDVAFCFIVNGPGVGMLPNMDEIGADVLRWIASEAAH